MLFRRSLMLLAVWALPLLWTSLANAADDKDGPVYTDPKDAGPDYAAQGEFKGNLAADDNRTWGAQIVALGNGKYRLVGYPDGLPGDGFVPGNELRISEGERDGDRVIFKDSEYTLVQQGDRLTVWWTAKIWAISIACIAAVRPWAKPLPQVRSFCSMAVGLRSLQAAK